MKTHNITVDDIGDFSFKFRTMRTSVLIMAEYEKIVGDVENPSLILGTMATWLSVLKVLIAKAPTDWDIDNMDPLDPDSYTKLSEVYSALVGAENTFLEKSGKTGKGAGKETGGNDKAMVSKTVPATAEPSFIP